MTYHWEIAESQEQLIAEIEKAVLTMAVDFQNCLRISEDRETAAEEPDQKRVPLVYAVCRKPSSLY